MSTFSLRTTLFFVSGIIFLAIFINWHVNQTIQLAYFTPKVIPVKKIYSIPVEIDISKVNLRLPIEETNINNGVWQIAQNGASHLTISARPGENGPIIIYSHNTSDKFGPIRWLSIGDTIQIKTSNGKNHLYIISQTLDVSPDQLDVFTTKEGEKLILYTCDGFADLKRFVVIANPY